MRRPIRVRIVHWFSGWSPIRIIPGAHDPGHGLEPNTQIHRETCLLRGVPSTSLDIQDPYCLVVVGMLRSVRSGIALRFHQRRHPLTHHPIDKPRRFRRHVDPPCLLGANGHRWEDRGVIRIWFRIHLLRG